MGRCCGSSSRPAPNPPLPVGRRRVHPPVRDYGTGHPTPTPTPTPNSSTLTGGTPLASGSLTLLATVVADSADRSSALIADTSTADLPGTYSVGYTVRDRLVVTIGYREVELRAPDGSLEVLRWTEAVPASAPEVEVGIRQVAEDRFTVPRSVLAGLGPSTLAALGRAQPHRGPDGAPEGFRLASLREGMLPRELGLKNGDVVHAVGGHPLTSAGEAMAAFAALQGAGEVCVDLTRRGTATRLCYTLE